MRAGRRWCRGRWPGSAPVRRSPAHNPRSRGRRRTGWSASSARTAACRAAARLRPWRRRARPPTPAGPARRPAPARPVLAANPAAGGRRGRWRCRRCHRSPPRPTAGGADASASGTGTRFRPATSARGPAGLSGVGVSTVSSVRPNRSVATMLVVRAPTWMPSVTNGSWLISTGTRGRPMAPETARSARSRSRPASSSAMTWRFTVAMLSDVTPAMTSRPTGPRNRTARKTDGRR